MEAALYGPDGFYRTQSPRRHFRTSVHASSLFAEAVARLLREVDDALGKPAQLDFVDMGAGDGALAEGVLEALPEQVRRRVLATAVEVAPRPSRTVTGLVWTTEPPERVTGLIFANEWLDNVPLDVVVRTPDGPRLVLVDASGTERLGPEPAEADLAWLARWWPHGDRAEIGRTRDAAWTALVGRLDAGVAVAADYAHTAATRRPTLTAYRDGLLTSPTPDGTCDLTAHVALDSAAAAAQTASNPPAPPARPPTPDRQASAPDCQADSGSVGAPDDAAPGYVSRNGGAVPPGARSAGGTAAEAASRGVAEAGGVPATASPRTPLATVRTTQRAALRALGVTGVRPPRELAVADPRAYLRSLARAGECAELTDPGGLGGFGWLMQSRGVCLDGFGEAEPRATAAHGLTG